MRSEENQTIQVLDIAEDDARHREISGETRSYAPGVSSSDTRLPTRIGGRYRPLRFIARGGMGSVYEVEHVNTGGRFALKLMRASALLVPDQVRRFRREARIHSVVKSEHLVRVVDADVAPELDDAPFLVMELLVGRDFERLCLERSPSPIELVDWMRQLAGALDRAHAEGVVHRDLKPENLFLAEREGLPPIVKILDFGIAHYMNSGGSGHSIATGQILGTPRYMAPEQAAGAKSISSAADRFALGLIAFRLLRGRHYYENKSWVASLAVAARGPVARPPLPDSPGCPGGSSFDVWFAKACAREPAERFRTCAEQTEALALSLGRGGPDAVGGRPPTGASRASRLMHRARQGGSRRGRRAWQAALSAGALLGFLAWAREGPLRGGWAGDFASGARTSTRINGTALRPDATPAAVSPAWTHPQILPTSGALGLPAARASIGPWGPVTDSGDLHRATRPTRRSASGSASGGASANSKPVEPRQQPRQQHGRGRAEPSADDVERSRDVIWDEP